MKKLIILFTAIALTCSITATADDTPTVSASKVSFKYCEATYGSETIGVGAFPIEWNGNTFTKAGTYVVTLKNHRGCDSIVTLTIRYKEGAIPFAFSVASNKQVYFSKGNLQYCAAPTSGETMHDTQDGVASGIWRFAEHQYDYVGGIQSTQGINSGNVYVDGVRSNNLNMSASYTGWQDNFRYGASGYDDCLPYGYKHAMSTDLSNTNYDWGKYNAISNGGNTPGMWYNMTPAQWTYLLSTRTNAAQKYSKGIVNNVLGLILLPDAWTLPDGCSFTAASLAKDNKYDKATWQKMEEYGAVFLPASGYMGNSPGYENAGTSYAKFNDLNTLGYYWINVSGTTSTGTNSTPLCSRQYLYFNANTDIPTVSGTISDINADYQSRSNSYCYNGYRQYYFSVRLVCDAE